MDPDKYLQSQVEKYKKLYYITEQLHSLRDVNSLLSQLCQILQDLFPDYSYYLHLSHNIYSHSCLPIIELEYDNENIAAARACVSGEVQFEQSIANQHAILYAPLKGHQGVYGVLQIIVPNTHVFPENDAEFIAMLAGSVGCAYENAQIYQQSQQNIANLKLLNDTSRRLNSSMLLDETMSYISEQIKSAFNAQEVGYFLFSDDHSRLKTLPGSTAFFYTKQARIYIDYIKDKILSEKDSLFIGDITLNKIKNSKNFHSIMAVPVIQNESVKGIAIVMHQEPFFFSFEIFKLLQSLINHSSLALINSMLRDELKKMVITDHLTKLHSRKFLDEKIEKSFKKDHEGSFILIDIDDFKEINDSYGHQVGDKVLIQVAELIKSSIRKNDIGARWGGEELVIYLPNVGLEAGKAIAERLVEKVRECSKPPVTVSCGVAYWHKDGKDSYQSLFKRADEALYRAKVTGKNKVVQQADNMKVS